MSSGREGNRWESLVSNKAVDDIDEELLKKYTTQAHEVGRIAISYTDKETVINQLELTEGNALLNAEKVLFSDDIVQDLQMAIFATNDFKGTMTVTLKMKNGIWQLVKFLLDSRLTEKTAYSLCRRRN